MKKGDFIGISCLDQIYELEYFPVEDQKIRAKTSFSQSGGFATNAAKTYALLGGQSFLHTVIGGDLTGQETQNDIELCGVKVCNYLSSSDIFSGLKSTIFLNRENGTRTIVSSEKDGIISKFQEPIIPNGNILFVDGFFIETAINAARLAKKRNIPVVFDADKWRHDRYEELLPFVDYVIAGDEFYPPQCKSKEDIFEYLTDLKIEKIAITEGEYNIKVYEKGVYSNIPIVSVKVIDSLGAGDVLHGAFCYFIQGESFIEALHKASRVATKFCQGYGFSSLFDGNGRC